MKPFLKYGISVLVLIGLVLAVRMVIDGTGQNRFDFVERQDPEGFRDLILDGGTSRPGSPSSLLAGLPAPSETDTGAPVSDICRALFDDSADPVLGPAAASVTVVEFFDYQCPYCRKVAAFLRKLQAGDPRVRVVFKEWPIFGQSSQLAARAALAARRQGRYLPFHEVLMSRRGIPTEGLIRDVAESLSIDADRLLRDANSPGISAAIDRNRRLARRLGFIGTPSFVVGRTIVEGALTRGQLEDLIDLEAGTDIGAVCRPGS